MKTKYFDEKQGLNEKDINEVANGIVQGKNAIFLTETVYGISANAFDEVACKKIFEAKGRPNDKPLIILISSYEMLEKLANKTSEVEEKLMKEFWPGPLTIIFEKRKDSKIPDVVTSGSKTIGIRMTSSKIAHMLIQKSGVPIVAPSANLTGKPTGTKVQEIIQDFKDKVDYVLDSGDIEEDLTSTLVKVENEKIHILREGKITKEQLKNIAPIIE